MSRQRALKNRLGSPWRRSGAVHVLTPDAATFLASRAIGDHRFETGPWNRPDARIAGVPNDLRRLRLVGSRQTVETLERHIETGVLSEPKAIDYCLGRVEDGDRDAIHGVYFHAERKRLLSEPHNSGWGVSTVRPARNTPAVRSTSSLRRG